MEALQRRLSANLAMITSFKWLVKRLAEVEWSRVGTLTFADFDVKIVGQSELAATE
jgi:hypothetical protein